MADIFLALFISSVIYGVLVFAAGFCSAIYIVTKKYIVLKDYINITTPLGLQRDGENTTPRIRNIHPPNQANSKTSNYGNTNRPVYQNTYNEGILGNNRIGLSYLKPNSYNGYVNKTNYTNQDIGYQQNYDGNQRQHQQNQPNYGNFSYSKYNSTQADNVDQLEYDYYDNHEYQYQIDEMEPNDEIQ